VNLDTTQPLRKTGIIIVITAIIDAAIIQDIVCVPSLPIEVVETKYTNASLKKELFDKKYC
jgi:hypothetical protein